VFTRAACTLCIDALSQQQMSFAGKVIVITGASDGIGA
jgi:hypothetical protein